MITDDAAHADDSSLAQRGDCRCQRRLIATSPFAAAMPIQRRPAKTAGQGLSVEAAIERVRILVGTVAAQWESIEGCVRPIIRHRANQRVARSALSAVDEWIAVAPRRRVTEFRQ